MLGSYSFGWLVACRVVLYYWELSTLEIPTRAIVKFVVSHNKQSDLDFRVSSAVVAIIRCGVERYECISYHGMQVWLIDILSWHRAHVI